MGRDRRALELGQQKMVALARAVLASLKSEGVSALFSEWKDVHVAELLSCAYRIGVASRARSRRSAAPWRDRDAPGSPLERLGSASTPAINDRRSCVTDIVTPRRRSALTTTANCNSSMTAPLINEAT